MSNIYTSNRVKTENRTKYTSKIFPLNPKGKNYYNISYTSQSPSSYYSKTKDEKEYQSTFKNPSVNSNLQKHVNTDSNIQKISPRNTYNINKYKRFSEKRENQRPSLEKSFQGQENSNHSFYVSEFTKSKNNNLNNNALKNQNQIKYNIREINLTKDDNTNNKYNRFINTNSYSYSNSNRYNTNNNNNNDSNINKNRYNNTSNNNNNPNYKERKTTTHISNLRYEIEKKDNEPTNRRIYTNKSYQGNKFPPKYYRNNPLLISNNDNLPKYGKNQIKLVAQKICNIYIRRSNKANKNKRKNNNELNKSKKMIEYEEENENLDIIGYKNDVYLNNINNNYDINHNKYQNSKKNKKNKIEKKNSNYEMQKAQSFEQPRDINYNSFNQNTNQNPNQKYKNKKNKYEFTQLKQKI